MFNETIMCVAIDLSRSASLKPGTKPFAAIVVRDGEIIGRGLNHAMAKLDPTAHGEVEAIRDACQTAQSLDLRGCELYSSCEPCSLCVSTAYLSGIRKIYYGTTMQKGSEALASVREKLHVDPFILRAEAGRGPQERVEIVSEQHLGDEASAVLWDWARFVNEAVAAGAEIAIE